MVEPASYEIELPQSFWDSYKDDSHEQAVLAEDGGSYLQVGSYDFLIAQARYFAWPHLTAEILAGVCAHEDTHNILTTATALGHLELHLKTILEFAPKTPPVNNLAKALRKYLAIIVSSCTYAQETAATMSAYCTLCEHYGQAAADRYLEAHRHKRPSGPSPYTTLVDKAIDLYRRRHVRRQYWAGHMTWLASLAMNTDIDTMAAAFPDVARFGELCARSPMTADLRFFRMFGEFEQAMGEGGLPVEKKKELERSYNHISKTMNGDLPRLMAEALEHQAEEFELSDYERLLLDYVRKNPFGYPGQSGVQTVFYATQPPRRATARDYLFHMDDDTCAECNLVEMGLATSYENSTYGGISINLYITAPLPIRTCFWMLHPCCVPRCGPLLNDKILVVYLTRDFLHNGEAVESIRTLIRKRRVIYVFFGSHGKFLTWTNENAGHLVYTMANMRRPPVRFVLFRDQRDLQSTYVLPIAPIPCDHVDGVLSTIRHVTISEFADEKLRSELDTFFLWYVTAPVTC